MRVWIDLSNSPHPLLFAPIARRLEGLGHEVGVTARDNAQTVELTLERWPTATVIGNESPGSRSGKARAMVRRIRLLRGWGRRFGAHVALSHNSYGQIVASRLLGVPVVTAMDYEGQPANHLAFRLANRILMPEALHYSSVSKQGATSRRTCFYDGFKEEVYLGDFEPDPRVLASLGLAGNTEPLVVARTPPSRASYHRFGNELFEAALRALSNSGGAQVVVLARHREQREEITSLRADNVIVPEHAIDSRSLIYYADVVLGAGGTMTREAALMGVPTYSLFAGEQPAVDRELESRGDLRRLRTADELLPVVRRSSPPRPLSELHQRANVLSGLFVEETLRVGIDHARPLAA